jgi:hypothetical protein
MAERLQHIPWQAKTWSNAPDLLASEVFGRCLQLLSMESIARGTQHSDRLMIAETLELGKETEVQHEAQTHNDRNDSQHMWTSAVGVVMATLRGKKAARNVG